MEDLTQVFSVQGVLFALMIIGFALRKLNVVDDTMEKGLTALIINLVLPCNIIMAFYVEFSMETLVQTGQIMLVSLGVQLLSCGLAMVLYNKKKASRKPVLQYGTLCSNAGLLGNPVAEGLFGTQGLLLASVYLVPQRTIMWSVGVAFFANPSKEKWWVKVIRHPCIIAVFTGMVLMLSQWKMPVMAEMLFDSLGGCTMALSMIMIGLLLSDFDWRALFNGDILLYCFVRLVAIPLLVYVGCLFAGVSELVMYVSVILAAMPAGATTVIIANSKHGDTEFAVGCVTVSTVLSMLAIPIWCMVIGGM